MENNIYKIRLGQWQKREIAEGRVIFQCSECGNVDNPTKTECSICKAQMMEFKEET